MLEEKKKKDFVKKPSEFFKYLINWYSEKIKEEEINNVEEKTTEVEYENKKKNKKKEGHNNWAPKETCQ
jgi:hypothetical protein